MIPLTEFRTLSVSAEEPADRTTAGAAVGTGDTLDLGSVDTTDEARDTPVRVFWWRVTDLRGALEVTNIRVWVSDEAAYAGTNAWHLDITDTWTRHKSAVQVTTGDPGTAPDEQPDTPNLERIGGGPITGTTHDQTSRYLYVAGTIGVDETTEAKSGPRITVTFDYH